MKKKELARVKKKGLARVKKKRPATEEREELATWQKKELARQAAGKVEEEQVKLQRQLSEQSSRGQLEQEKATT